MKAVHIVGARPNFMKAAPVVDALGERGVEQLLIHTGQHYDANMSRVFFDELALPTPDLNLGVGSGSHARQTAEVLVRVEEVLCEEGPDLVIVYGDVNSTLASALAACKLGMPVAHVEAGLRSFDRAMPEEINRVLTDRMADLLFTPSEDGNENLANEGVDPARVHMVGNVMIDTLVRLLPSARDRSVLRELDLLAEGRAMPFVLVTLHRPSNVDDPGRLARIMASLCRIAGECPVVFPIHPRTREKLAKSGSTRMPADLRQVEPLGYLDFLCLEAAAGAVVTDSGGIQEETTYLGVPCLTVRRNTERPITLSQGTNMLVGDRVDELPGLVHAAMAKHPGHQEPPAMWDGRAAARIADVIVAWHG